MDGLFTDLDRISALPDDLLHVILTFLGDALAVTRTAALSRRWRHVWTGAASLTFKDSDVHLQENKSRFAGFVDWVLARRGDADMESLKICIRDTEKACPSPTQLNEWLRYAALRVVESTDIDLGQWRDQPYQQHQAVELPSHGGRAASISFFLANYWLRLPATSAARYEALTELDLVCLFLDEDGGGGSTLGDFVASCCPRLRRLHISGVKRLRQLVLRSEVLEEFDIYSTADLRTLDMATPNLRVFNLSHCFAGRWVWHDCYDDDGNKQLLRIAAPKLEEIGSFYYDRSKPMDLDIHGLTSVRRLAELYLDMHGKYHPDTDIGFWLLESCTGVEHVSLWLEHKIRRYTATGDLVDLTSEGKAPFASVRSMSVCTMGFPKRHFVASMSSLFVRCPHLTSLSVQMDSSGLEATASCFCDDFFTDKWEIHGEIVLGSLEEVEITGFRGTDEERQLVRLLF